jgi:hypothetical protein
VLRVVVAHQAFEQRVCEHFLVHLWGKCEQMEWIKRHFSSTLSLSIDRNHGIIIIIRVYFFVVFVASGERFQWKSIFAFKETRFFVFFFFFRLISTNPSGSRCWRWGTFDERIRHRAGNARDEAISGRFEVRRERIGDRDRARRGHRGYFDARFRQSLGRGVHFAAQEGVLFQSLEAAVVV